MPTLSQNPPNEHAAIASLALDARQAAKARTMSTSLGRGREHLRWWSEASPLDCGEYERSKAVRMVA